MKKILFIILFLITFGLTAFPDDTLYEYPMFDFTGGLNLKDYPDLLKPNQCREVFNLLFDDMLGLVKRKPYDRICNLPVASSVDLKGGCVFKKDDGSKYYVVQAGSDVYSCTDIDNPTWTKFNPSKLSTLYPLSYAIHYNKLWCSNGINKVFTYDGTTSTEYSFIPKGQLILSSKGRLWIGSTIDNPNNIYISDIHIDPITSDLWDTENNVFKIGFGSGQTIKAMRELNNTIYVFLESSFYGILGNAESSPDDFYIRNISVNYGCLSNNSISDYYGGINFLDKKGICHFEGSGIEIVSDNIKPDIDKFGLVNTNSKKIITTTDTDFNLGTYVNCYTSGGSIQTSTYTKTWTSVADFGTGATGSTQYIIKNDIDGEIVISTSSGLGYTKLSLYPYRLYGGGELYNGYGVHVRHGDNFLRESWNPAYGGHSWSYATDSSDDTYAALVSYNRRNCYYQFAFDSASTPVTKHVAKIRIKYQWGVFRTIDYYVTPYDPYQPSGILSFRDGWMSQNVTTNEINTCLSDLSEMVRYSGAMGRTGKEYISEPQENTIDIKNNSYYTDSSKGYPSTVIVNFTPSEGTPVGQAIALKIYDVSAWSYADSVYYSSAIYISPVYTAGGTPYYQYLQPLNYNLGIEGSSGTISFSVSSGTPNANWYSLGTDSATNSAIDGSPTVQWKAIIWTSSITVTPTIYDVTLQYIPTLVSTYTSRVFDVGTKLTSWGSFLADDEGTNVYQIRSGTWTWAVDLSTPIWSTVTSGDDITVSTNHTKVQYRIRMDTKDSVVKSVILTYFENFSSGGGSQDVASVNKNNRYLLSCSTINTYNDLIEVQDKNGAWTRYKFIPSAGFLKDDNNVYVLSSTYPVILQLDVDNGSEGNFNALWKSGDLMLNQVDKKKWLRYVFFTSEKNSGSVINFDYSVDGSTVNTRKTIDFTSYRNVPMSFEEDVIGKTFTYSVSSTNTWTNNGMLKGLKIYNKVQDLNPAEP
ncbi:MAG: hypothetical protein PHH73_00110 [Candidatus Rickettsiella isopodorum]|nr:hypothetical protein [Candidatus Rickettsiella isopodorum]